MTINLTRNIESCDRVLKDLLKPQAHVEDRIAGIASSIKISVIPANRLLAARRPDYPAFAKSL